MPEWKEEIKRRLAGLRLGPAREAEIVEELAQHMNDRHQELVAAGATAEEARRVVLAELSERQLLATELAHVERQAAAIPVMLGTNRRSASLMSDLRLDLLYAIRTLRKQPGFAIIAIATLALGIGVNTAIFTFFDFLLRPMPVTDPDSVINLEYRTGNRRLGFSFSDYIYFRDSAQSLSGLIAHGQEKFLLAKESAKSEEIAGEFVSDDFFSLLGGRPMLGRTFAPEENTASGREAVVVLSYRLWQRLFGGDPQIIGKTVILTGKPFEVIGVTQPDFVGLNERFNPEAPELWLPLIMRSEMPYSVSTRTREIGIRMALGAQGRDVLAMVFGQGMRPVGVGVALGLAGGAALSRVLSALLFGLSTFDVVSYMSGSLLLAAVALVAIYFPARRAASVDPMFALRYE